MAEGQDRVQARVDNVSTVKPILEALRTISLGSWQSAMKKRESVGGFAKNYLEILEMVAPYAQKSIQHQKIRFKKPESEEIQPIIVVLVGSERGLCGAYNQQLLRALKKEPAITDEKPTAYWVLGTRLFRMVKQAGFPVAWFRPLS